MIYNVIFFIYNINNILFKLIIISSFYLYEFEIKL